MAQHAAAAQQQHHAPQQQRAHAAAAAPAEPLPLRGAPHLQVRRGHGSAPARSSRGTTRRLPHPQRRPYGGAATRDAQIQHRQIRQHQLGHAAHKPESARAAVGAQHWPETVRQVRVGAVAGHGVGTAVEAEAVGQADGEGPRLVPQDARVGLRRGRHHAAQVTDP